MSVLRSGIWVGVFALLGCEGAIGDMGGGPGTSNLPDGGVIEDGSVVLADGRVLPPGSDVEMPAATEEFYPPNVGIVDLCGETTERGASNVSVQKLTKDELLASMKDALLFDWGYYELQNVRPYRNMVYTAFEDRHPTQIAMNEYPVDVGDPIGEAFIELYTTEQMGAWSRLVDWFAHDMATNTNFARDHTEAPCFRDGEADAGSAGCFEELVREVGPRAFRRPLSDDEVASIAAFALEGEGIEEGVYRVVSRLFLSPHFMHILLPVAPEDGAARVRVDQFQLASRVSYALTGHPPDAELYSAAEAGELSDVDALRAHASRIIRTEEAREKLTAFFFEWLDLEAVTPWQGWTRFNDLGFGTHPNMGETFTEEARRYVQHVVWDAEGDFQELMSARIAFPFHEQLQVTYGVDRIDESGPVDAPGHPGLLARAAILASEGSETNPIRRAIQVKVKALCQTIPSPEFSVVASRMDGLADLNPVRMPSHEVVTALTADAACEACHRYINPVGFLFDAFNPMGERQEMQQVIRNIYDWEDDLPDPVNPVNNMAIIAEFPLLSGQEFAIEEGDTRTYESVDGLIDDIAVSQQARSCMGVRFFRHLQRRSERREDACSVREGVADLESQSLLDAFVTSLVNEDIFWRKP